MLGGDSDRYTESLVDYGLRRYPVKSLMYMERLGYKESRSAGMGGQVTLSAIQAPVNDNQWRILKK